MMIGHIAPGLAALGAAQAGCFASWGAGFVLRGVAGKRRKFDIFYSILIVFAFVCPFVCLPLFVCLVVRWAGFQVVFLIPSQKASLKPFCFAFLGVSGFLLLQGFHLVASHVAQGRYGSILLRGGRLSLSRKISGRWAGPRVIFQMAELWGFGMAKAGLKLKKPGFVFHLSCAGVVFHQIPGSTVFGEHRCSQNYDLSWHELIHFFGRRLGEEQKPADFLGEA